MATPLAWALGAGAQAPAPPAASAFQNLAGRAAAAQQAGQLQEAAGLYQQALALRPKWARGWWLLGSLEYDESDYAGAARAFRQATLLDPGAGTARVMLGLCEFDLGRYDAALRDIEAGRRAGTVGDPQFLRVMWYHEGLLRLGRGEFDEAQAALQRLARAGADNDDALAALGMAALRIRGRDPNRIAPGARAAALEVGNAEALAARHDRAGAERAFQSAIGEYPRFMNLQYAYGRFLLDSGEPQAAIAAFQREIHNTPDHVLARLEIAEYDADANPRRGLPYAQQAVRLDPQLGLGQYLLGLLLVQLRQPLPAIPHLEKALRSDPASARVYFVLAKAYAQARRTRDASRARAEFLRLSKQRQKPAAEATN